MKEGRGILVTKNSSKYYGYFKKCKKNIKGKLSIYEVDIYEGEWLDDKTTGKGNIHIQIVPHMMVNGKMTNKTEMMMKHGMMFHIIWFL